MYRNLDRQNTRNKIVYKESALKKAEPIQS